jgi:hypothetical protein
VADGPKSVRPCGAGRARAGGSAKEILMKRDLAAKAGAGVVLGCAFMTFGCDSRGQNEREFLNTAPPGIAPEDPGESYASKRGRLQEASKKAHEEASKAKRGARSRR